MRPNIALGILVGPKDVVLARTTVPHIVRSCAGVTRRVLVIDVGRGGADADQLRSLAAALASDGCIDQVVPLESGGRVERELLSRHVGGSTPARDHRGVPLLGWVAGMEATDCEYYLHFDCDVLVHDASPGGWLMTAVELLKRHEEALVVAPHPGPLASAEQALIQPERFRRDTAGALWFQTFSSRRYLMFRPRFARLLPLRQRRVSRKRRLLEALTGVSSVLPWETLVTDRMREAGVWRVHLGHQAGAWALHLAQRGPHVEAVLPDLVRLIERGDFPEEQIGRYDVVALHAWSALGHDHA